MQVRVREVTTGGELSSLGAHWDKVVWQAADTSPFLSLDWITSWWDHFGEGRKLFVLVAEDGDGIAGIAPFVISRYRFLGLPLRVLELAGAPFRGRCLSTRPDLIVRRRAEECLAGCDYAPCLMINERRYKHVRPEDVPRILDDPDNDRLDIPRSDLYDGPEPEAAGPSEEAAAASGRTAAGDAASASDESSSPVAESPSGDAESDLGEEPGSDAEGP